jgi:hypothetical protein
MFHRNACILVQGAVSEQAKAASMKMYGRLTRDIFDWHPDKLLCKRFNVPNPYPEYVMTTALLYINDKHKVGQLRIYITLVNYIKHFWDICVYKT